MLRTVLSLAAALGLTAVGRAAAPAGSGDAEAYLRYVHPTVKDPFPDLVSLAVPAELCEWHMLIERPAAGPEVRTAPLDRPVLYRRGKVADGPESK